MRIAPVLLPYLRNRGPQIWTDAALATAITHRDTAAIASSVAWVAVLWDLLGSEAVPDADWWAGRFTDVAREVESSSQRYRPHGGEWQDFEGTFSEWLDKCRPVMTTELTVIEAGRLWYSGAYVLETVPTVLHILTRHAQAPEEAMIRAVNDTRDNDTIAAIVGAALGALYGAAAFPDRWRRGLLGRLAEDDDGRLFTLIQDAVEAFA